MGTGIATATMAGLVLLCLGLGGLAWWLADKLGRERDERSRLEKELVAEQAQSQARQEALQEKLELLKQAENNLRDTFEAASAKALKANSAEFLLRADEGVVKPMRLRLQEVDAHIQEIRTQWAQDHGGLNAQLQSLTGLIEEQKAETGNLVQALRTPHVRGRWGEEQLKRVVELAGMVEYCDFQEQVFVEGESGPQRPDMIVRLPQGKRVVVDAKTPAAAYFESLEAPDEQTREACLKRHAEQVWTQVERLAAQTYWDQFKPTTPEFVVMFLPGEMLFRVALERNLELMTEAMRRRVIIASPFTLLAVLKAVSYGWRQEVLAQDVQKISDLGKDLYTRLRTVANETLSVGTSLGKAVDAYNSWVGSLERRVLVSARRFRDLKVVEVAHENEAIPELTRVDQTVRPVTATELQVSTTQEPEE